MADATRRGFLGLAGAGVAAASAATLVTEAAAAGRDRGEPLVAYLEDGTLTLMTGEREVVVRDPDLVRRLRTAAGR